MLECDRLLYAVMCVIARCRLNTLSPALFLCINQYNYLIFNFEQLPLWSSTSILLCRVRWIVELFLCLTNKTSWWGKLYSKFLQEITLHSLSQSPWPVL